MATYQYVALDKAGKTIKKNIDAETEEKAKAEIRQMGLTLVELKPGSILTKDITFDIGGKPKPRDMGIFCKQFVGMTRAGVPIVDTLRMLHDSTENKKLKESIDGVRASIEKGETLSDAFKQYPNIYPDLMINMTSAGEISGKLDTSLERMGIQFEKNAKTQALIKKAMIYPIIVLIVAIAVVAVMLLFVIPNYMEMFESMDQELPGITKMVVALSNGLQKHWFIVLLAATGLVFGIKYYAGTDSGKHLFGKIVLKIPVTRDFAIKTASSLLARTMSTLLAAGVSLVEAVEIVSTTMSNIWIKEALIHAKEEITAGVALSKPLEECGLFPPMVYNMIRIGEESGTTEEMMEKLADYYEEEVEMAVQSLMAAMEPVIIMALAGIVGVLIASVMAPMLSMYQALDNI